MALLEKIRHLRVSDIRDGLDWCGRHERGSLSPEIKPLYRTQACGFATTLTFVRTQRVVPTMPAEDYTQWAYEYWYRELVGEIGAQARERVGRGSFLVSDLDGTLAPAVGSTDSMLWANLGARGVVTNGGVRDTDEIIYQRALPVWSKCSVQPMFHGRVEFRDWDEPVTIGGELICPGDLIVADGDGVVVVPIDIAETVVHYAIRESENDKRTRRMLFAKLGIEENESTEPVFQVEPHPYAMTEERLSKWLPDQNG